MRELIINKILWTLGVAGGGIVTVIKPISKKWPEDRILKEGCYPVGFDWNRLTDEELVEAFSKITRCAFKNWA